MNFTTLYLLLCIIFSGRGDKRWKKEARENAHNVIGASDESAEMERDIRSHEDDFGVTREKKIYNNAHLKLNKHKNLSREILYRTKPEATGKKSTVDIFLSDSIYITNNRVKNISKDMSIDFNKFKNVKDNKEDVNTKPKWPKFEDLLLSFGIEYDWKSDRWIKLKEKINTIPDKTNKHFNTVATHQKHEFKYRTVRINGSKRRKNVIIALTAIR